MLWDDQNVIGLKVKLMEQAKKLAALHNRVTNVQTQCQQLLDSPFKDLVKEEEALGVRSLLEKRKLLLRLCDLEERILCAEIGSQHTSIDSFVLLQGLKEIRNTVHVRKRAPLVPSESTIGDRLVLQGGSMMRLKSSSSSSTNPRPSYPSDPGREPTLTSCPKTIALYSRSQHPPSLAMAQPTHSPQRVVAPHSPPYYSTSTPQPLSQEARETNCTFSFESSYRQQHHGRETAPFSPPNYSTSTTQPLSPEAGETNYTLSSMSSNRQRNTRQNRRAVPTSPQNYSTSTTQPMSPEPSDTNYTLSSRSGDHPHLQSRKTAKHKGQTFAIDEEQTAIGNEESMEISEESHWPSESKTQWKMAKMANPLPDRHRQRQIDQQRPFPIELLQQPQLHEHHPLSHGQKPQQQKKQKQAQPRPLPQPPQPQLPAREQRQPQQRESRMRKHLQLQPVTLEPGQQQIMQSQGRQQQVRHPQNRQQQDRQRQARHQESQQEDLKQYQQSSQQKSRRKKMDPHSQSFIDLSTMEALEYEDGNASHIAVIHVSDPQQTDPIQSQGRQQKVRHAQNRQCSITTNVPLGSGSWGLVRLN